MDPREQRGQEMAKQVKIVPKGDQWIVPSAGGNGKYLVKLDEEAVHCTCPDFEKRGQKCKHIFAVEFTLRTEVVTEVRALVTPDGEVAGATLTETVTETATQAVTDGEATVTETKTRRKTYRQVWPAYNAAQTHEKRDFLPLLHDLCQDIEEPARPKMGRPPLPLRDMAFAAAFKVYSTFSGRRFISDLADAYEKGFVSKLPHYNSIFNYLENETLTPILEDLIIRSSVPLQGVEIDFATDSTCFSTSRFEKWFHVKWGHEVSEHGWVKAHFCTGVITNIITAVEVTARDVHDCTQFEALADQTAENFAIREMSADKGYISRANVKAILDHGGMPFIPFKRNMTGGKRPDFWQRMFHFYSFHREEFLTHYHKRSNAESTVSMVKGKFGDSLRSKTDTAQKNEVLCKVLCHNLCCLIQSSYELKIDLAEAAGRPAFPVGGLPMPAQALPQVAYA